MIRSRRLPLEDYCTDQGIPYADLGLPVTLETFSSYGLEFQKRFVPDLEDKLVVSLDRLSKGFKMTLDDGEVLTARRLVMAVGLSHFAHVPPILSTLSGEYVSHSSACSIPDQFKGREVSVVGAGVSALDLAALLHQAGAVVQLVARKHLIRFHDRDEIPRPLLDRIRFPTTGLGPGWNSVFYSSAPLVFCLLPEHYRLDSVRRRFGPAAGWFTKDEVVGKVPFNLGVTITQAKGQNSRVSLQLTDGAGDQRSLAADHVIAATGYKVDLRRLTFLAPKVQAGIRSVDQTPVLSSNFESSLPGLYFVGASAANTFGPLLRFAFGARFTARRISRHLAKSASRNRVLATSAAGVQAIEVGEERTGCVSPKASRV
jgi:cation diffusion facilitator CzcD-associated flavoprotein CzcO